MATPSTMTIVTIVLSHSVVSALTTNIPPMLVTSVFIIDHCFCKSAMSLMMAAQFATMVNTMQQSMLAFRAEPHQDQKDMVEKAVKKAHLSVTFR